MALSSRLPLGSGLAQWPNGGEVAQPSPSAPRPAGSAPCKGDALRRAVLFSQLAMARLAFPQKVSRIRPARGVPDPCTKWSAGLLPLPPAGIAARRRLREVLALVRGVALQRHVFRSAAQEGSAGSADSPSAQGHDRCGLGLLRRAVAALCRRPSQQASNACQGGAQFCLPPPQRPELSLQQESQHWELREQGRPFGRHVAATCAGDRTAMLSTARPAITPTRRSATRRPSARRVSRLESALQAGLSMSPAR
jgi:hypothetical protein